MTKDYKLEEAIEMITNEVMNRLKEKVPFAKVEDDGITCKLTGENCTYCGLCIEKKPDAVENIVEMGASRISTKTGVTGKFDSKTAGMIDHTLLKPNATREDLVKLCEEAKQYSFATCCVNAANIPLVARLLKGSSVKPIAVVGFPLGAGSPQSKAFEARDAVKAGAQEIDMVINIGSIKSKDYKLVYEDILAVVNASKPAPVKVIIESSELEDYEKVIASALSKVAGAAFVKTSTGFAKGGATVGDIELIRKVVGSDMQIKASGGIRTKEDADAMIAAGANRIGASASIAIVTGKKTNNKGY